MFHFFSFGLGNGILVLVRSRAHVRSIVVVSHDP